MEVTAFLTFDYASLVFLDLNVAIHSSHKIKVNAENIHRIQSLNN